ncbi:MAG: lipoprotein [Thermodesulfovibrionales bacterium]
MARKILIIALVVLAAAACSKKEVKRDSLDSRLAREAFEAAEELRKSYVAKDFGGMREHATQEAYDAIVRDVKRFESVELSFTPRWVEIEGDAVILYEAWKGTWKTGDEAREARGLAVFEMKGTPLKLTGILRGNPFDEPKGP